MPLRVRRGRPGKRGPQATAGAACKEGVMLAMRILMISTDFVPLPGGLARHVIELSKALCALGHDVMVLSVAMDAAPARWSAVDRVRVLHTEWPRWGWRRFNHRLWVARAAQPARSR